MGKLREWFDSLPLGTTLDEARESLRQWEREHPACNKTVAELRAAFWPAACEPGCADKGFNLFLRLLGQEQPEEEHKSDFRVERALACADQMEKEHDEALAQAEKPEPDPALVEAIRQQPSEELQAEVRATIEDNVRWAWSYRLARLRIICQVLTEREGADGDDR